LGRAQVFWREEMVLNTYFFLFKCLLLPKIRAANQTALFPPKIAFSKAIPPPYFISQYAGTNQQKSLVFKAYLMKLVFDNLKDNFSFIVIHSFSIHHSR
jgi:hypothetical protein